jgi:GNAT superfamily N-acetyltransferase
MAAGSSPAAAAVKADILARAKGAKLYVALGPGEAPLAIGAGLRAGETVWANAMYTVPEARGQGLAGRLLTAIADWARAQGIARLHLQVEADNPAARRLYGRFGFQALYPYHYRTLPRPAAAAGATERGTC